MCCQGEMNASSKYMGSYVHRGWTEVMSQSAWSMGSLAPWGRGTLPTPLAGTGRTRDRSKSQAANTKMVSLENHGAGRLAYPFYP